MTRGITKIFRKALFVITALGVVFSGTAHAKKTTKQIDSDPILKNKLASITVNAGNAESYFNKGANFARQGNYDAAIAYLNLVIHLQPKHTKAYNMRADIFQKTGKLQSALIDYSHAIALSPSSAKSYYNRGVVQLGLNAFQQAISDFSKAISLNANFARAYNERAIAWLASNNLDAAKRDFLKAVELNSNLSFALDKLGYINMKKGLYREALVNFTRLLDLKPDDAKAYLHRGKAYEALQQNEQALQDFDKALELGLKPDEKGDGYI